MGKVIYIRYLNHKVKHTPVHTYNLQFICNSLYYNTVFWSSYINYLFTTMWGAENLDDVSV